MDALVTEGIVLHAFDYLETSRIVRLMTRDAGVQSVLARGAKSSRKRFGSAIDLFAQGMVEIHMRPNRDLQSLASFDVTRARPQLASGVGRFTAGSMIAEVSLRWASEESSPGLFDAVELALDKVAASPEGESVEAALAGAWHIVATLGFTPALDVCANCHTNLDAAARVVFSHTAGGALCANCGKLAAGSRVIPSSARDAMREWTQGGRASVSDTSEARAHQRLLREFFQEHLGSEKEFRAYRVWEQGAWSAA